MNICVSMITLNEEQHITRALESCHSFADSIAIVDGGSTDKTIDIIERDNFPAHFQMVLWADHFGNQHQHSTELVPPDADWWMRLDSDEAYPKLFQENIISLLEQVPEDIVCCRIRQINLIKNEQYYSAARGGWETWPRIFRNLRLPDGKSAWKWQGQVHEYCRLLTRDGLIDPEAITLNLPVIHYGWLSEKRREEREALYMDMKGSGFEKGSLTERTHIIKELPYEMAT